jgi:hypothetical protein
MLRYNQLMEFLLGAPADDDISSKIDLYSIIGCDSNFYVPF